jgi:hypothetical protein
MLEKVDKKTGQLKSLPAELIDDPGEQEVIQLIRGLRASGIGSKAIARALDAKGIACRGHRWHYSTIRAVLKRAGKVA